MTNLQVRADALSAIAQTTRRSALKLGNLTTEAKNLALEAVAEALNAASAEIVTANQADCQAAMAAGVAKPLQDRLKLDESKLQGAIAGVRDVARLADPVGAISMHRELDAGLTLKRISCPLGVLGVVFESRPDAVMQIASLAIKSGNGVILKGGKEAINSCTALVKAIRQGLASTEVDPDVVQLLTTREEILELLNLDKYVDLIIPRGSNSFVRFIQENTKIPVLGHADGICHLYVDKQANLDKAVAIALDSKTQYPAACNAVETLLIHRDVAHQFLPAIAASLRSVGVELRGDALALQILPDLTPAIPLDWETEYTDLILSIRVVDSLEEAIAHIEQYGSRHTEAIVTENRETATTFLSQVDAAGVYHNCSTRFADGFRYGFGAEVGISTQKMPPRGPVGLEGLVTYKYQVLGNGHIVADYSGTNGKSFTHKDLPS
jgi:glutamate-5-semialdehyde dehydrogenase